MDPADPPPARTVADVVLAAAAVVAGAEEGGVSITTGVRDVRSYGPTCPDVVALDRLQAAWLEGPVVTLFEEPPPGGILVADDLDGADSARWPGFAEFALDAGYRSTLTIPLLVETDGRAALTLLAREAHVFGLQARVSVVVAAAQAAMLIDGCGVALPVSPAGDDDLVNRVVGILTERFAIDDAEAEHLLAGAARDLDLPVVDVARWHHHDAHRRRGLDGTALTRRPPLLR